MERDRRAVLIRQAAFEGVVDFSKARPSDPGWWSWLRGRLGLLEQRNADALRRMRHGQSLVLYPLVAAEHKEAVWGQATAQVTNVGRHLFPWLKWDGDDAAASTAQLRDLWAAEYGDPADPETQRRIWATARALDPTL